MISSYTHKEHFAFYSPSPSLGGTDVVSVGTASSNPLFIDHPSLCSVELLLFEKFDGGTEARTPNPMRTHGSPWIISPGHYRSCYPAVETGGGDSQPTSTPPINVVMAQPYRTTPPAWPIVHRVPA